MSSTTTTTGSSAESVPAGGLGAVAWTDPTNALTSDNVSATAVLSAGSPSTEALRVTGFDFGAVPDGATLDGIEVRVEGRFGNLGSTAKVDWVELVLNGAAIGIRDNTDHALPSGQDQVFVYGSSTSLWGADITRENLDESSFGAQLVCARTSGSPQVQIDSVTVTVYWTAAPWRPMRLSIGIGIGL